MEINNGKILVKEFTDIEEVKKEIYKYENNWLKDKTVVIFDIETTSLNYIEGKIIEIGAVKMTNSGIEHFDIFLNPNEELSDFTTELTGITQKQVDNGYDYVKGLQLFYSFINDCDILVGQNSDNFDIPWITYHLYKYAGMVIDKNTLDTMNISKQQNPLEKKHSLTILCERYDVEYDSKKHHRADYDCEITLKVLEKQMEFSSIIKTHKVATDNMINHIKQLLCPAPVGDNWQTNECKDFEFLTENQCTALLNAIS